MTLHLFSSIRHAMCRSGRGLCLAPRVFAVFRQLFLLGVLALSAVPAFADGVPSEPQDGLTAIKNALVPATAERGTAGSPTSAALGF